MYCRLWETMFHCSHRPGTSTGSVRCFKWSIGSRSRSITAGPGSVYSMCNSRWLKPPTRQEHHTHLPIFYDIHNDNKINQSLAESVYSDIPCSSFCTSRRAMVFRASGCLPCCCHTTSNPNCQLTLILQRVWHEKKKINVFPGHDETHRSYPACMSERLGVLYPLDGTPDELVRAPATQYNPAGLHWRLTWWLSRED